LVKTDEPANQKSGDARDHASADLLGVNLRRRA
jgi:hypothetical protein